MTARRTVVVESLDDHRNPLFSEALRLYRRVFPEKERIDRAYFVSILEEKRRGLLEPFNLHFLVARAEGRVRGLAVGSYLAVVNLGFVGYLAVDPAYSGAGMGRLLRERLVRALRRDARAAGHAELLGVLGEVEAENPWLSHLLRNPRLLPLDIQYRQPALGRNVPAVPLVLYLEATRRPIRSLPVKRVRALLYAIYRRVYRIRFPLRNPAFRAMMRELKGRRTVGRRKLRTAAAPAHRVR